MKPSSHFFDKFVKVNITDWAKVAEKELNGKPLESLNYVYGEEIIMPPVVFSEKEEKRMKPTLWKKNKICQRGISFNRLEIIIEKDIESFISIGINHFKLKVTEENKTKAEELKRLFPSCYWLDVNQEKRDFSNPLLLEQIYLNSEVEDPVNQISDIFHQAILIIQKEGKDLQRINNIIEKLCFSRNINVNYLFEISLGRAQRIVWRNILKSFEINNPVPPMFISNIPVLRNGSNDNFLVEATARTLSAILGGTDLIYLEFDEITKEMRSENLAHIHNILTMETGIGETIDPIAGSFYFDELTTKIAQQIWDKLKS
jgi:hypothetical protein